ncbi:hypothetical protein DAI22_01g404133 [Oryza sativa Japonica Group]|nr:hypothetical protein DAI22_01g404133 [Oryza sativa Japonica Group]
MGSIEAHHRVSDMLDITKKIIGAVLQICHIEPSTAVKFLSSFCRMLKNTLSCRINTNTQLKQISVQLKVAKTPPEHQKQRRLLNETLKFAFVHILPQRICSAARPVCFTYFSLWRPILLS